MNYFQGLHRKMILQIKWKLGRFLCLNIFLKWQHTLWFLTSMLSRVFKRHISKGNQKFSDLTIHNELIKIITLKNGMCIEKEKGKIPLCGDTEQMSQKTSPVKRKLFHVYGVRGKFHCLIWCINCITTWRYMVEFKSMDL